MTDLTARTESALVLDLLMHGLRVRDDRLNAVATELLTRFGGRPARQLVLEAVSSKNSPGHRIRALAVLARIAAGPGLDVMDVSDLGVLLHAGSGQVRSAATCFFGASGAGRTLVGAGDDASAGGRGGPVTVSGAPGPQTCPE